MSTSPAVEEALKERFYQLPKVVQDAMLSTDVETHLREMSKKYKLQLDKWQILEDEVMFTLLGIKSADELLVTIEQKIGLNETDALALTADISQAVFEPIRGEMERELGSPEAHTEKETPIEAVRTELLGEEKKILIPETSEPPKPKVFAATPPLPKPEIKSVRTEVPPEVKKGTSTERKVIANDLYREQL